MQGIMGRHRRFDFIERTVLSMQLSTVQCSLGSMLRHTAGAQCSSVMYSAVQYSALLCCALLKSPILVGDNDCFALWHALVPACFGTGELGQVLGWGFFVKASTQPETLLVRCLQPVLAYRWCSLDLLTVLGLVCMVLSCRRSARSGRQQCSSSWQQPGNPSHTARAQAAAAAAARAAAGWCQAARRASARCQWG
jgi:hypothetical protein